MLGYFPKYYTDKAILVYFMLLFCVPFIFGYPMEWYFWIIGIIEVVGFFYFANILPQKWGHYSSKIFIKELFFTALIIRVIYVLFSYWFYILMTDQPFEFGAADSLFYDDIAKYGHYCLSQGQWNLIDKFTEYANVDISDAGFPLYLTFLYWIFDDSILISRLVKAIISAWTCVLVYNVSLRNFGEKIGRMSAVFCMIMPNLIYYCGIHLKETEMVFLLLLFIDRVDYSLRLKQLDWKSLLIALLSASLLFMFRTALAIVAFLSLAITLILSNKRILSMERKVIVSVIVLLCMIAATGNKLLSETEELLNQRSDNRQTNNMEWRAERMGGNQLAKYAGAAVFAPMIFTIPFPTLVNTPNQELNRHINGGNYVKNITSAFTILALIMLLFSGKWRDHVLILSICCGYLIVIALSEFAHSERFHLPALPFSLILAAFGISQLQNKHKKWFNYWIMFIFVANIAWAWFKLKGRGM